MMKWLLVSLMLVLEPFAVRAQGLVHVDGGTVRSAPTGVAARGGVKRTPSDHRPQEVVLTTEERAIAQRVFKGRLPCELGVVVVLSADLLAPGYFDLKIRNETFRMHPVATSTGTIRLEDPSSGVVWLQLPNKSMLMSQKLGQRLADACASPEQVAMARILIENPAPGLLDTPLEVAGK